MSKEVGEMVRSRDVVQAEGSARPESVPTTRRPGRAPWRRGSGGAPAGSATWCCGYWVANRWRRCPVRWAWRSPGSKSGGSGPWLASSSAYRIGTAKAIARSTHGFGSWMGSESPARGCCASCGRTDCSPRTARQGTAKTHDGRVITQAPNVMWGTDGVRVFTLDDGWGWIFAAVEPWNAECVGWHVCQVGSRFAALDPMAQGLERL